MRFTISCVREWNAIPYHIEISPIFRINENKEMPEQGYKLMGTIAKSLKKAEES